MNKDIKDTADRILSAGQQQQNLIKSVIIPTLQELGTPEGNEKANRDFVDSLDSPSLTAKERQKAFRAKALKQMKAFINGDAVPTGDKLQKAISEADELVCEISLVVIEWLEEKNKNDETK